MDHKTRVLNALTFQATDRPPFDMFDECGSLFTDGLYDPALRMGLPLGGQIEARIRFHEEFDTDLIFDAPVIGASATDFRASLAPDCAGRFELKGAFFPLGGCVWMPWSPHIVPRSGHHVDEVDLIGYILEWDNGIRLPLFVETASGNPAGYEQLMKHRDEWPLWKEVLTPSLERFDYSFLTLMASRTKGDAALYGTILCPHGIVTTLLGLEPAATLFFDDPEFFRELMDYFTEIVIEVGRDMLRHGIDVLRVGTTGIIGPKLYEEFVLPCHRRIAEAFKASGGYSILHCCGFSKPMLESFAKAGWTGLEPLTPPPLGDTTLADAKKRIGATVCLKGNLDPVHVMKYGTPDSVARAAKECLRTGSPGGGYILSVADCMAAGTPRAHMEIVADIAHGFPSARSARRSPL